MDSSHIVSVCFRCDLLWLIGNNNNNHRWIIIVEVSFSKGSSLCLLFNETDKVNGVYQKMWTITSSLKMGFRFYLMCV